jgi:hypothetical protein
VGSPQASDPLADQVQQDTATTEPKEKTRSITDLPIENPEKIPLDEDVYGAVFFSLTFDISEILSPHKDDDGLGWGVNLYRLIFTLLLLCANYLLQIGLVVWVYSYVASSSVHKAQIVYQNFHADVFKDGKFQMHLWDKWDQKDDLCGLAFCEYWFVYAILSLWWIAMITEMQKTFDLCRKIVELPITKDTDSMVYRTNDNDEREHLLWQLTAPLRAGLLGVLFLPKLAICAGLWWVGTVWLAATDSFENLVMNSVALTFVTSIDELIYTGLIPVTMKRNITITNIVKKGEMEDKEHENVIRAAYQWATVRVAIVVLGVAFYMSPWGQSIPRLGSLPSPGIFPGYGYDHRIACRDLWARQRTRVCTAGEECFPLG